MEISLGSYLYAGLYVVEGVGAGFAQTVGGVADCDRDCHLYPDGDLRIVPGRTITSSSMVVLAINVAIVVYLFAAFGGRSNRRIADRKGAPGLMVLKPQNEQIVLS